MEKWVTGIDLFLADCKDVPGSRSNLKRLENKLSCVMNVNKQNSLVSSTGSKMYNGFYVVFEMRHITPHVKKNWNFGLCG